MSAAQAKIALAGLLALIALFLREHPSSPPATVTKEGTFYVNVLDPESFGEPATDVPGASDPRLIELVAESNRQIAAFDATHPEVP